MPQRDREEPKPKKALGQHWLHDETSLLAMCEAAGLAKSDTVLEIGPGMGTLTKFLAEGAERVIAVEFDAALARELPGRVPAANLETVHEDILHFDFTKLPAGYKVIANIPYYLTSNLIRVLSETANPPERAVLLVQEEVAERVAAKPGDMSILSATAQYYWEIGLDREVPAELFTPPPKVDSRILVLKRRQEPLFPGIETKPFFRLVKAGFSQRRKTLLNALSGGLRLSKDQIDVICGEAGIDPGRRAQTLSLEEWHMLYRAYPDT
jgi:16S rRNA (adenine1518-N6/adenine1519-N6)-dimethyltransferase